MRGAPHGVTLHSGLAEHPLVPSRPCYPASPDERRSDEDLFESDRWRQNALVADGWRVLRFTWRMLKEHPEVVVAAISARIALKK